MRPFLSLCVLLAAACDAAALPSGPLSGGLALPPAGVARPASPFPPDFIDLVAHAGWIFQATVTELHAATEPAPPPWADPQNQWDLEKMVVVRIDQVAVAPLQDELVLGSQDTIILRAPPSFGVGFAGYFLVSAFEVGRSWVFTEQGRLPANAVPWDSFAHKVNEVRRYLFDRALYDRMVGADRVIVGTVQQVARLPGGVSDNQPEWWQATVGVDGTLRGPRPTASPYYPVRYEGSGNPCCIGMPKLHVSDHAILLLYPDTVTGLSGDAFLIIDPLDLQRTQDLVRLEALLGAPPEPPPL
ncbi:MAG TPA: hypothetical protein VKN99_02640 [Polyangia bacterium]|nr:hypothetical protein [Polyangia bacterium]